MKNILAIVCAAVFFCWMPKGAEGDTLKQGIAAYKGKDYTAALKIIRPLAIKGGARAQFYLGLMYEEGDGVAKDLKEAVKWYRKAADQGYDVAQTNLGVMYEYGKGVAKDLKEAVTWFRKAADQGYARAQKKLGLA